MTIFTELHPDILSDINDRFEELVLNMANKMCSPTWSRHIFWVMSLKDAIDFDEMNERFGSALPVEGYPEELYHHHMGLIHFVGEYTGTKVFAQKRERGWFLLGVNDDFTGGYRQVTHPYEDTGKLGWDLKITEELDFDID